MDAHCTGLLSDSNDRELGVFSFLEDQVGQFVNHNHNEGQLLGREFHLALVRDSHFFTQLFGILAQLVVFGKVAHLGVLQQGVPAFHLMHGPLQDTLGFVGFGHHGTRQVGDGFVRVKLHLLGIHQHELHFIWTFGEQPAHQDGVDAHRLAGTRGSRNQHVRHLGEVIDHRFPRRVFPEVHGQAHLGPSP